jgi:hypothetical protein
MSQLLNASFVDWASGAITSMEPDNAPPNSFIRGRNTELASVGGGKCVVRQRRGFDIINATPITGSPEISGLVEYRKFNPPDTTQYELIWSDTGRLDSVSLAPSTYGDLTNITTGLSPTRTLYGEVPQFTQANNILYKVDRYNDGWTFDGTNVRNFGIIAPSTAPTLAAGAAGSHNGTYEARVTYGNSLKGTESSAGPTSSTATVVNTKLSWTAIPVSSDAQVDTRYLYIRNTATMEFFYLVGTISNNTDTTATTDVLDVALTTLGPDTTENDPPPDGIAYIAYHKNRLFISDLTNVYYSKLDNLEAFDPFAFESPASQDGQQIRALISYADMLVIFKETSTWALVGDDPDFWQIRMIDPNTGCIGPRSVCMLDGAIYWWSENGPYRWDGSGQVEFIGIPFLGAELAPGGTNDANVGDISYHQSDIYRMSSAPGHRESPRVVVHPDNPPFNSA